MPKRKPLGWVIGACACLGFSAAARAALEEIIVTARKTEETVQTTPVAITAVSSEGIERAQVKNVSDLQGIAPGLTLATGSPGSGSFVFASIRGQGALNASVSVDPAVATYIDGVYIARPSQGLSDLLDMERVEVLRGPQGTLFGRNTTGGAINIYTKAPTNQFEGSVFAGIGNNAQREAGFTVNAPLTNTTAFRMNYIYKDSDGWAKNETLNRAAENKESHFANAKLLLTPSSNDWEFLLAADYNRQQDGGQMIALSGVNPLSPSGSYAGAAAPYLHSASSWYKTYGLPMNPAANPVAVSAELSALKPYNKLEAYGASLTATGPLNDDFEFKSITAYRFSNSHGFTDLDGTPVDILAANNGFESYAYSQELQVSGDITDAIRVISGLYWSTENGKEFSKSQSFGVIGLPVGLNQGDIDNDTYGVYLQGYMDFTDRLSGSAGLRWTWDEREVDLHNLTVYGLPGDADVNPGPAYTPNCNVLDADTLAPCSRVQNAKFNYPAWTVGLDYKLSETTFLYAKTSRASKAGGWNLRVGAVPAFDPEELTDIEVGIKSDITGGLRVNAAYFHSWQKDVQRTLATTIGEPPRSTAYILNAGKAQIDGVELEVLAALWEGAELTVNGAWMEGSYDSGTFTEQQNIGTNAAPVFVSVDRSDEPLLQLPEWQFGASLSQRFVLGSADAVLNLGYKWIDEQHFSSTTLAPENPAYAVLAPQYARANALGTAGSYGLWYGSFTVTFPEPNIELSLWGRNLTDEKYVTRAWADNYASLGIAHEYVGEPRSFGARVKYRF